MPFCECVFLEECQLKLNLYLHAWFDLLSCASIVVCAAGLEKQIWGKFGVDTKQAREKVYPRSALYLYSLHSHTHFCLSKKEGRIYFVGWGLKWCLQVLQLKQKLVKFQFLDMAKGWCSTYSGDCTCPFGGVVSTAHSQESSGFAQLLWESHKLELLSFTYWIISPCVLGATGHSYYSTFVPAPFF